MDTPARLLERLRQPADQDPLDWFPKPRFLQEAADENILADLAAFLREDPSLAAVKTVTFTSEGDWHSGSGS